MTTREIKNTPPTTPSGSTDDEIDLIALAQTLWNGRKTIIKSVLAGLALGLIVALTSPKEFTASTTMVPQTGDQTSKMGGLSSLAAMAGVNLGSVGTSESLSPTIYPQILQSVPFQLELMNSRFNCPDTPEPVSLFAYYTDEQRTGLLGNLKKYTLGLPGLLIRAVGGKPDTTLIPGSDQLLRLTKDQDEVRRKISEQISLDINEKDGYITLSARFSDALLAAQVARKAQTMLQDYITRYKLEKAAEQLNFVQARFEEKKTEFDLAQKNLALFRDRNKNVSSALAMTEQEQLQSQYNLAYSIYSELAKQVEQAQIQVKEDTPILTVIEPVRVPLEKSKPNRPLILIIWIFLAAIVGTGLVFGREFYAGIKDRWQREDGKLNAKALRREENGETGN